MDRRYFILKGHDPVPCDLLTWARWLEENRTDRIVAQDTLPNGRFVSTVFLGLDHNWLDGPPLLFETMIFASDNNPGDEIDYQRRYSTWEEAEAGHALAVNIAGQSSGQDRLQEK